jgi:TonB family protein
LVDEKLVANGKLDIRPVYPAEAQAQRLTGSGVFLLRVDAKNGQVTSVEIQRTTGHKILDDASVTAFGNLRFKPHGVLRVTIPISFEMPADNSGPRVTRNFPATWLAESAPLRINSGRRVGRR